MAWSTPRNWSAGELVTAGMMNSDIRDNFNSFFDGSDLFIPATGRLMFDGSSGHTFIDEAANDILRFVVGGAENFRILTASCDFAQDISLLNTKKLYLGGPGSDTYITEAITVNRMDFFSGGTLAFELGPNAGAALTWNAGTFSANGYDRGAGLEGIGVRIAHNINGTGGAGWINLLQHDGTNDYFWTDTGGTFRIHSQKPTLANDVAGIVVGTQVSWHELKYNIEPWTNYDVALAQVIDTPLHSFRFKGDSKYGDRLVHGLVGYSRDDWFMCNTQNKATPVLADSVIYGALFASIKALEARVRHLEE